MIGKHELIAVTADWLMPISVPPIPNGWVVIRNGMVEFVGSRLPAFFNSAKQIELPGFAILPGLINAHCHLEFSDLHVPISAGESFAEWISKLLAHRRLQSKSPEQLADARREAIASGIRESYAAGVRWVVDVTTQPWDQKWIENAVAELPERLSPFFIPDAPIVTQPCVEILDISPTRLAETLAFALRQVVAPESNVIGEMGYAPHAPYTTSLSATKRCVAFSRAENRLITMHLGESADETAWLEHRNGGFPNLLGPVIGPDYFQDLGQITDYVSLLIEGSRGLIAHGNYLSEIDLKQLASRSATMAIVHCPRTHRHFGHQHRGSSNYPLAQRRSLGIRHLIGTDSRASNPDLNLWSEVKQVRADHPSLTSESILRMITLDAAEFLGVCDRYGTVRSGVSAMLTAVRFRSDKDVARQSPDIDQAYDVVLAPHTVSAPLELVLSNANAK